MKNKQKKAMTLPYLERVKDMAFIKRVCIVTVAPCMCLCCWPQLSAQLLTTQVLLI